MHYVNNFFHIVLPVCSNHPHVCQYSGPLLFMCRINDLQDAVKSIVRLFADDCLLYRNIKTERDHTILQQDLAILEIWAKNWEYNMKEIVYILCECQRALYGITCVLRIF
jgi:hypothetical protein